jgi:hypothetical protein
MAESKVGVKYGDRTYWGTVRLAKIKVKSDALDIRIQVDGSGYSEAGKSLAKVFGGWLTVPRSLARELGEYLLRLSDGSTGDWVKDYPEEAARQAKEKLRESTSALRDLTALPRRVAIRQYQMLLDSWLTTLNTIDRYSTTVSREQDGEELVLNLRRRREAVLQEIDEIKQTLTQLQKEDEAPEL